MHIIAEKRKWTFTICDKLISGALLGNFLLIASSILVGFFSNYLNKLFELYTLLTLSALFLFLFRILRVKKWRLLPNIKFSDFGLKIYALPILLFALFVLFFHTLYLEYDAVYAFFPYAKSIALTGTMKYNVYYRSTLSTGMPPILPVIYAWAFTTINDLNAMGIHNDFRLHDMLRPIPAAYFLLTALVIYLIARETLQKKHAFLSVIIFMSFPSTILTLSAFTYYLDLGFVFYLVSAMLCLMRALKTRKPIWFFLTGVAGSLLLLTKELSVFIIPLIFSMFILFSSIRYRRAIFVILSTLPFYLVFIWDIHGFPISAVGWILMRQLPVFALSAILYFLSNAVRKPNDLLTWKNLVLFLIPFIPSVVFFLRGIVFLGSLYSIWGPAFNDSIYLFHTATGTQKAMEVTNFFRWDIPFLSLGLGVSYLIPILFSIVYLFKRRHQGDKLVNMLVLMMLFTLLETMSFTLVESQAESRRTYYFAPILAIFAANGLMLFDNLLKSKYFIYLCTLFNSLAISYIWLYRFPFQTLLGLSYLKTSIGLTSTLDLAFLLLVFVGVFLVLPFAQKKLRIEEPEISKVIIQTRKRVPALPLKLKNLWLNDHTDPEVRVHTRRRVPVFPVEQKKLSFQYLRSLRVRFHMRRRIIYVSLFTLSCLLVVYPTIPLWLQGANEGFLNLQYDVYEPTWENGILSVSYYYNAHIDDHFVTVSFGGSALRYFANRSLIDLATVMGVQSMQNILTINVSGDLLHALNNSNIRYFLIPRTNNSFHHLYLGFRESFYLFKFIEQDEHFSLIRDFSYYQLVRFENAS